MFGKDAGAGEVNERERVVRESPSEFELVAGIGW